MFLNHSRKKREINHRRELENLKKKCIWKLNNTTQIANESMKQSQEKKENALR